MKYYWIAGPCRVKLLRGIAEINGVELKCEDEIVIHRNRSYTVIASEDAELKVDMQEGGEFRKASSNEALCMSEWRSKAEEIVEYLSKNPGSVAVLGDVDAGKTTFSTLLANLALRKGLKTYFIDADLGQASIGVPGFISMVEYTKPLLWPRGVKADRMYYVGSITPAGFQELVILGVYKLTMQALSRADVVVIDTDGWVLDSEALDYKFRLIMNVKPKVVVLIGNEHFRMEYERVLSKAGFCRIEHVETPPTRRVRSRRERMLLRGDAIILENLGSRRLVRIGDSFVTGTVRLGFGESLSEDEYKFIEDVIKARVLYGERLSGKTIVVTKGTPKRIIRGIIAYPVDILKRMLVCIVSREGEHEAPGLIEGFDKERKSIIVRTPYNGDIAGLVTGFIACEDSIVKQVKLPWIARR